MRLVVRFLVLLSIAAGVGGCAGTPFSPVAAGSPEVGPPPADIDNFMYGRGSAYVAREPVVAPIPVAAPIAVPVAVLPPPVPAALLPGPAPGGDEPYTLDSGDRLRIVVFGQEGLTSTYIVDATGKISMPLIGAVNARGCTTGQLARLIADKLRNGFVREPHVAIEVEFYRPFFILGEVIAPGLYPYVPNMTVEIGRDRRRLYAARLSLRCRGQPLAERGDRAPEGAADRAGAPRRHHHRRRAVVLAAFSERLNSRSKAMVRKRFDDRGYCLKRRLIQNSHPPPARVRRPSSVVSLGGPTAVRKFATQHRYRGLCFRRIERQIYFGDRNQASAPCRDA